MGGAEPVPHALKASLKEADLAQLKQRLRQMQEGGSGEAAVRAAAAAEAEGGSGDAAVRAAAAAAPTGWEAEGGNNEDNDGESGQSAPECPLQACSPPRRSREGGRWEGAGGSVSVEPNDEEHPLLLAVRPRARGGVGGGGSAGAGDGFSSSPTRSSSSLAAVDRVIRQLQRESLRGSTEVLALLGGGGGGGSGGSRSSEQLLQQRQQRRGEQGGASASIVGGGSGSLAVWFEGTATRGGGDRGGGRVADNSVTKSSVSVSGSCGSPALSDDAGASRDQATSHGGGPLKGKVSAVVAAETTPSSSFSLRAAPPLFIMPLASAPHDAEAMCNLGSARNAPDSSRTARSHCSQAGDSNLGSARNVPAGSGDDGHMTARSPSSLVVRKGRGGANAGRRPRSRSQTPESAAAPQSSSSGTRGGGGGSEYGAGDSGDAYDDDAAYDDADGLSPGDRVPPLSMFREGHQEHIMSAGKRNLLCASMDED